jgi:hypothetical protein
MPAITKTQTEKLVKVDVIEMQLDMDEADTLFCILRKIGGTGPRRAQVDIMIKRFRQLGVGYDDSCSQGCINFKC